MSFKTEKMEMERPRPINASLFFFFFPKVENRLTEVEMTHHSSLFFLSFLPVAAPSFTEGSRDELEVLLTTEP